MKTLNLNLLAKWVIPFCLLFLASCEKELETKNNFFDIDAYLGRYEFIVDAEQVIGEEKTTETYWPVGYVRKDGQYGIKVLFDVFTPKINCKYSYLVKDDGTFLSLSADRRVHTGKFDKDQITFSERIDLGNGDYKLITFTGSRKIN